MINAQQFPSAAWRKSTYSGSNQGECLEVADGFASVPVRDSKQPTGSALLFETPAFTAFVSAVRQGQLTA